MRFAPTENGKKVLTMAEYIKREAAMRDKLVELLKELETEKFLDTYEEQADYLIDNGVIAPPCKAGNEVWVVERDECGDAHDIAGYLFIAVAGHAVILSPIIGDLETIEETLDYHIAETAENYDTNLAVFPLNDCYTTREEAEAALKGETNG